MQNKTEISFECFKSGKFVHTFTIDPDRDKNHPFKQPVFHGKGKLYAHTVTISATDIEQPHQSLNEVTTKQQFNSLILAILAGKYGMQKKSGKPNIVMVTIHLLEE